MIKKLIKYAFNGYLFDRIWCILKGKYYTIKYVNSGTGKIVLSQPYLKLHIKKETKSRLVLNGDLILTSHCNGRGAVTIQLGAGSLLQINSDFSLGQNNKIHVSPKGQLIIAGKETELVSGITCDSMIMCFEHIDIGTDLICGWNVYITDSDWHTTTKNGIPQPHHKNLVIGNHCWLGSNVILGKGTTLHNNVVVGAYTKLANIIIEEGKTVAGITPRVLNDSIIWNREI